jgi:hypothetical protein
MPTATDFKDYYATLGVSKTATPEEIKRSKISMKQIRYSPIQTSGRSMTNLGSTGIALVMVKHHHLVELMSGLKILVSMVILTRLSTIYWVEDVEIRVIDRLLAALMILLVGIALKLPHQILKPRSPSLFPKRFMVSSSGFNSTTIRLMSAFPQVPSQVVGFGSKVEVAPVRSRNSAVTCI